MPSPEGDVGEERLHHPDCPRVAHVADLGGNLGSELLGLVESTLVVPDECEQSEGPAEAAPVACLGESVCGLV